MPALGPADIHNLGLAGAQYVWRRAISRSMSCSMSRYFSIRRRSSFASGV